MRVRLAAAATLAFVVSALPAAAENVSGDASGRWKVAGHIDGKDFTLDCRFQQSGDSLTGACVDGPTGDKHIKGGKSHPLTKGRAAGDQITWTYVSSYGFLHFNVDYSGVRKGERASGQISAVGKSGTFTAERS